MSLFRYEDIKDLGSREVMVYEYVVTHTSDVAKMSIRELAAATGVSTTTVLRFCSKVNCKGFDELKYLIKRAKEEGVRGPEGFPNDQQHVYEFLEMAMRDEDIERRIDAAAQLLAQAGGIHFLGVGTSGNLGAYGARYFANLGFGGIAIHDPFYPKPTFDLTGTVLMALSVSGETEQVILQASSYLEHGAKLISITNTHECLLARMSQVNLAYYMPTIIPPGELGYHNVTTQLPCLYYVETLARRACVLRG